MKRLALLLLTLCSAAAFGQNFTAVSGAKTQDAGGNLLATGQICFIGTDQNDSVIGYQVGGGGQAIKVPVCSNIISGVITGFNVANPATTSPSGIYYRVTITDSSSGQEILRYKQVTFSGATFSFDSYVPIVVGNFAPLTGNSVSGNLGVTGNVTATGTLQGTQITSSVGTGTAPFVVASSTVVGNLNSTFLLGQSWGSPAAIGSGTPQPGTFTTLTATVLKTATNCAINTATPGACGAAITGVIAVPTTTTSYTVNTTAVTATSRIFINPVNDNTGIPSAPTCTTPAGAGDGLPTARVAGTSFTFGFPSTTGVTCWNFLIVN